MKTIYLDQNIISDIANKKVSLPNRSEVKWVFSIDTILEIGRSKERWKYVEALSNVGACPERQGVLLDGIDVHPFVNGAFNRLEQQDLREDKQDLIKHLELEASVAYGDVERYRVQLGLGRNGAGSRMCEHENPIEGIWDSVKKNAKITKNDFFGFSDGGKPLSVFEGSYRCYRELNKLGFFPDRKLNKKANVENGASDRWHVARATNFDGILSRDSRLCEKARAIYVYKSIGTTVFYALVDGEAVQCKEKNGLEYMRLPKVL